MKMMMKNPWVFLRQTLAAVCLYSFTFGWLLPAVCRTWVYSVYFNVEKNAPEIVQQVVRENDARLDSANTYLASLKSADTDRFRTSLVSERQVDLVVGVVSINRETWSTGQLGFLTQTVARVLSILRQTRRVEYGVAKLFICNVDSHPLHHTEALRLSKFVDVASRFENETDKLHENDKFEKEKQDYVFCMKQAASFLPKFVMLVEDDVLLEDNSLETLSHLKASRLEPFQRYDVTAHVDWLLIKLYYPEKWSGYAKEAETIVELIGIALIGGSLSTLISLCTSRKTRSSFTLFAVVFGVGALTSVTLTHSVGRPYVRAWRRYLPSTHRLVGAHDCCTQAVLYPAPALPQLILYLTSARCDVDFAVDLAIDRYARVSGLKRFLVEPNVAKHIGFVSTVRGKSAAEFL